MADADEKPMVSIDPRYLLTGDVVERPPTSARTRHHRGDHRRWLAGPAQQIRLLSGAFDEFGMADAGGRLSLLRTTLHTRTLHPPADSTSF